MRLLDGGRGGSQFFEIGSAVIDCGQSFKNVGLTIFDAGQPENV
jgi:hypothetical protein